MTFRKFMKTYGFRKGPPRTPFQIVWSIVAVASFTSFLGIAQTQHTRAFAYLSLAMFGLFFVSFFLCQIGVVDQEQ